MISFTILGQCKSGKNGMLTTRTGRHYPNKVWAEWRDRVVRDINFSMSQHLQPFPISTPCRITFKYWKGDLRRRDVPGMIDAFFHCFEKAGTVIDDKLFTEVHWLDMGYDKKYPKVEMFIEL